MDNAISALATAAMLRSFCSSFEEAEQVMVHLRDREVPNNWKMAWSDIQTALLEVRK